MICCHGPSEAPEPQHLGPVTHRRCTDLLFLLIFLAFWAGMAGVAWFAITKGQLSRLRYGVDSLGNPCSHPADTQPPDELLGGIPWATRKIIWFPIVPGLFVNHSKSVDQQVAAILHLGICVPKCPEPNSSLVPWTTVTTYSKPQVEWPVLYTSIPVFNRCVPDVRDEQTSAALKPLLEGLVSAHQFPTLLLSMSTTLVQGLPVLGIAVGGTCAICLIIIFLFRWIVAPVLYLLLLSAEVLIILAGVLLMYQARMIQQSAQPNAQRYYVVFLYFCAAFCLFCAIIYTLVVLFLFKRIRIAIAILELSSKVLVSTPIVALVPPCSAIFLAAAFTWGVFIEGLLYTAGDITLQPLDIMDPLHNKTVTVSISEVLPEDVTTFLRIYNVFGTLWTLAFIQAATFMVIAFVGSIHYFSDPAPGHHKAVPFGGVLLSLWWALWYHSGTLAFGSFILAVIQLLRGIVNYIRRKMEETKNDVAVWIANCVECCLACLQRVVTYINRNGYIVCCIESKGFCRSCYRAVDLLLACLTEVAAANFLADWVFLFAKLSITAGMAILTYALLDRTSLGDGVEHTLLLTLISGLACYLVTTVFFHVYDCIQDTVLLCYCYDKEKNNGLDRPYYFTQDLCNILDKYNGRVVPVNNESPTEATQMKAVPPAPACDASPEVAHSTTQLNPNVDPDNAAPPCSPPALSAEPQGADNPDTMKGKDPSSNSCQASKELLATAANPTDSNADLTPEQEKAAEQLLSNMFAQENLPTAFCPPPNN